MYKVYAGGGSVFEDRNCIYSLLGALTAIGENDYPDAQDAEKGPSTIEEDPQFADASGGDFTPENKNLRDADGQFIGAVQTLPDMPAVGNVTDDDSVDDAAGTFVVPAVGDVEAGVQYGGGGDEFTGTLAAPSAPTVTLAEGDGQITATIAGDAGASHYVLYKKPADTGWCAGGNRTGDGDVTIADLDNNVPYMFVVYSFVDSIPSLPAVAQTVTLADSTEATAIDGAFPAANVQMIAQFGKTVIYRPAGGGSRPIKAVVKQKAPGSIGAAPGATSTVTTVMVLNDSTNGISSSEIDIGGGDKIDIAYRIGLEATARRIGKIVFQNPAVMKLEVR
ncbi:MAG: hypothetical protein KAT00_12170 [Planctomycetes bacterium]|nr:hypothetical protein [Planctomycetota bacterium]